MFVNDTSKEREREREKNSNLKFLDKRKKG